MANIDALKRIGELKIIPVVSIDDAGLAGAMADALVAGGLPIAEITFRTAAAEASIKSLSSHKDLLVGAGTVLNVDTAKRAADAGAKFIVSPGFNPKVVRWCIDNRVPITPGTATPTDIEMALDHGLSVVKFFPCESIGGLKTLKAIAAPYSMIRFIPTGGITAENLASYLKFAPILACGGSWMVGKELLAERKFDEVTRLSREAIEIANQARPKN
jgi:2-dehydro-3-deoxyphosphogluconate aldolase/(4S)-4-hydroxy-2-oxoglutarate aldolase